MNNNSDNSDNNNSKKFDHKPGTGSLFKNKFKQTEKHPSIVGQLKVSRDIKSGTVVKFSGWPRESENNKYYSLSENTYNSESESSKDDVKEIDEWIKSDEQ
jgi:arginine repressor